MPDHNYGKSGPHQFLNKISTEELKRILKEDFESEDSSTPENDEFITCVMEVIAQRETNKTEFPHFDVDKGWKDFQQNYLPNEGYFIPIYSKMAPDKLNEDREKKSQADSEIPLSKWIFHRILRILIVAAIVASLCLVAASAFEVNLFQMVAQWTQDIFQFQSEETIPNYTMYETGMFLEDNETLKPLLSNENVMQEIFPKWIPKGYIFLESIAFSDEEEPSFMSVYEDEFGKKPITVSVVVHSEPQGMRVEKDVGNVTVYHKNGVDHYIMSNEGVLVSTWFTENLEGCITGNVSKLEMETMIDSIYKE